MNQDKKIQVIMLASDKATSLCLAPDNKLYTYNNLPEGETYKGFELLFLSDDEVKEEDWFYDLEVNQIFKQSGTLSSRVVMSSYNSHYINNTKKIIASTDKSLGLSEPSKEWIKYFVSEYNNNNIITEVIVEYDKESYSDRFTHKGEEFLVEADLIAPWGNRYNLKVNPDNTINIKPVEETWTDTLGKEVINYAEKYKNTGKYNDIMKAIEFGYHLGIKSMEE